MARQLGIWNCMKWAFCLLCWLTAKLDSVEADASCWCFTVKSSAYKKQNPAQCISWWKSTGIHGVFTPLTSCPTRSYLLPLTQWWRVKRFPGRRVWDASDRNAAALRCAWCEPAHWPLMAAFYCVYAAPASASGCVLAVRQRSKPYRRHFLLKQCTHYFFFSSCYFNGSLFFLLECCSTIHGFYPKNENILKRL